jgi:mono/diheme cytochrome c family protein
MRGLIKLIFALLIVTVVVGGAGYWYVSSTELSARAEPKPLEAKLARQIRQYAVPPRVKAMKNPVPASGDVVKAGMEHFADHCSVCHGNDGRGDTLFGRGMYPRPPDLRSAETQNMSDGEIFHVIENGVRFTGMPAFGDGTADASNETWRLVHFIRHLPRITKAELTAMAALNPKTPEEWKASQPGAPAKASVDHSHTHKR